MAKLLAGWAVGMATGTLMAYSVVNAATGRHFGGSVYAWNHFGMHFAAYAGLIALELNLVVVVVGTMVLRAAGATEGRDGTREEDYGAVSVPPLDLAPAH